MKKRIFALLLAVLMLVAMVACASTKTPAASETQTDKPAASEGQKESTEKADEGITLHVAMLDNASCEYLDGEDITNNWWTKQYKERYNVTVVTDWSTNDSDTYDTKINLAMVSGNLPDTFKVQSLVQLEQLIDAGLVMDLTEIFDANASDLLKEIVYADMDTFNSGVKDGVLYGIAQMHYGWGTQPYYLWLRNDWMEDQGFSAPETIEDLETIMNTFVEEYGAWGYSVDKTLAQLKALAPAWGAYPDIWVKNSDGALEPGSIQPEMKEALAKFAEWYKNGWIDPNFTTYDYNAMNAAAVNGTSGAVGYQQWWGYIPGADVVTQQGAEAIFYPYEIPAATTDVLYPIAFDNNGYTVVSKDCEHPEAVIELMNFYAEVYFSEDEIDEGIQEFRTMNLNGYAHITGPFRTTNTRSEDVNLEQVSKAIAENDTSYLKAATAVGKYEGSMKWLNNHDSSGLGDYLQHGAGEHAAFQLAHNIIEDGRYITSGLWGKQPEIMNTYGSTLDDLLLEGFTKIIIGAESVDYFDTLVANWRSAGGDTVIDAVNEMYS